MYLTEKGMHKEIELKYLDMYYFLLISTTENGKTLCHQCIIICTSAKIFTYLKDEV